MALFCLRKNLLLGLCVIIGIYARKLHLMREKSTLCANADIYAWMQLFMREFRVLCVFTAVYARIIAVMRVSRDLCVNEVPPVAPNAFDQSWFI